MKSTKAQWEEFFESFVWSDIRTMLVEAKDLGVSELRTPGLQGAEIDFVRGKLEHIDRMLDLEAVVVSNFEELEDENREQQDE